jgi:hypothetical protein
MRWSNPISKKNENVHWNENANLGGCSSSSSDDNVITDTERWRGFVPEVSSKLTWNGSSRRNGWLGKSFVVKRRLNKPTNDGGINNWLHVGF